MELTQENMKEGLIERIRHVPGGLHALPAAPDSPILPRFDAKALAAAIECEVNRANIAGYTKMSIHLDIVDAVALAKFLRR